MSSVQELFPFYWYWFRATPSPGSLVALSRNRHSESGLVVTAITEEVQACLIADSLEVQESPEESVQLPYPSHPG